MVRFFLFLYLLSLSCFGGDTVFINSPEIPRVGSPSKVLDVFSISLMKQIHRTLFRINEYGMPVGDMISNFSVLKKGTIYKFMLKKVNFSDGSLVSSDYVKKSIETAVKNMAPRYKEFKNLIGFTEFISKSNKSILGIKVISKNEFEIHLKKSDRKLLVLLSDIRYAIVKSVNKSEKIIGAGSYAIVSANESEVILRSTIDSLDIKKVLYSTNCSKEKSNLKLYIFGKNDKCVKEKLTSVAYTPFKDYVFHFNARSTSYQERAWIYKKVQIKNFLEKCYPGVERSKNFVPKGFAGYDESMKKPVVMETKKQIKKLKIGIAKGLASSECARDYFKRVFPENKSLEIVVESTSKLIELWSKNKIDVLHWYLESEESFDHLSYFLPHSTLKLGIIDGEGMEQFSNLSNVEYFRESSKLSQRVIDSLIVIPLFKPKERLYYSKELVINTGMISSPTYLLFKNLRVSK